MLSHEEHCSFDFFIKNKKDQERWQAYKDQHYPELIVGPSESGKNRTNQKPKNSNLNHLTTG